MKFKINDIVSLPGSTDTTLKILNTTRFGPEEHYGIAFQSDKQYTAGWIPVFILDQIAHIQPPSPRGWQEIEGNDAIPVAPPLPNRRRLLIKKEDLRYYYKLQGDLQQWQFGGNLFVSAVRQAYERCFISIGDLVEDTATSEVFHISKEYLGI
jgi:hypothetical protein